MLFLSLTGYAKVGDGKEDELPPLPAWDPADEALVKQGEIVPGMDLFREDIDELELPMPPPLMPEPEILTPASPSPVEEEDPTRIGTKYHPAYFGRRPASYLVDPQELLSQQEFRDRESFLDYHAGDSEINLYIYLFDSGQELPDGVNIEGVLHDQFGGSGPTTLVFYYLGVPERTEMALSEGIGSAISEEELTRALKTAIEEALEKSEPSDQLDNFSVELSIRLYWFEKAMSGPTIVPVSSGSVVMEPEGELVASMAGKSRLVLGPMGNLFWGVGIVLLAGGSGWVGRLIARRRVRYLFPEVDTGPLLGAPHAAGVGAVISYSSAQVPPSQQRDQGPDFLQQM